MCRVTNCRNFVLYNELCLARSAGTCTFDSPYLFSTSITANAIPQVIDVPQSVQTERTVPESKSDLCVALLLTLPVSCRPHALLTRASHSAPTATHASTSEHTWHSFGGCIKFQTFGSNRCRRRYSRGQTHSSTSAEFPNEQSAAEKDEAAMLALQVGSRLHSRINSTIYMTAFITFRLPLVCYRMAAVLERDRLQWPKMQLKKALHTLKKLSIR